MVIGVNYTKDILFNPIESIHIPMKQVTGWYKLGLDKYNSYYYAKNGTHSEETDEYDIRLLVSYCCMPCNIISKNTTGNYRYTQYNFYKQYNNETACDASQLLLFKKWIEEETVLRGGTILSVSDFYSTSNIVLLVPSDTDPFKPYFVTTDYKKPDVINNGSYEGDFVQFDYKFADSEQNLQYAFGTSVFKSNVNNVEQNNYNPSSQSWQDTKNQFLGTQTLARTFNIPDITSYFYIYNETAKTFLPMVGWNVYVISLQQIDTYKINSLDTNFDIDENSYGITMVRVERDVTKRSEV